MTDFDSFSWDSKMIKLTLEDDSLDGNSSRMAAMK